MPGSSMGSGSSATVNQENEHMVSSMSTSSLESYHPDAQMTLTTRHPHATFSSSSNLAAQQPLPLSAKHSSERQPHWIVKTMLVCGWGFSNIGLLLSNRYLLMSSSFQQPVFLTLCHMVMSCLVPLLLLQFQLAPAASLTWQQTMRVAALAAVFAASVVCGNMALKLVHISFFQAVGATTPAFVAAIALVILNQRETKEVYCALVPVMLGLVVATGAEPSFNVLGFAATISATALRALKTVMQGLLLKDLEPLAILRHMACFATLFLLAATAVLEGDVLQRLPPLSATSFWTALLLNCSLALASNLLNIIVTKATSPLSLQVLGNFFGIVATVVSITIFHNPISSMGMVGYAVTMIGIALYVREKQKPALKPKQSELSAAKTKWIDDAEAAQKQKLKDEAVLA